MSLRKFRIEVEEESPDRCVETLSRYEHALQAQEVKRYGGYFSQGVSDEEPKLDHPWSDTVEDRSYFNGELGREVLEEVIEFDPTLPGYRGRRVVALTRIDTRPPSQVFKNIQVTGTGARLISSPTYSADPIR